MQEGLEMSRGDLAADHRHSVSKKNIFSNSFFALLKLTMLTMFSFFQLAEDRHRSVSKKYNMFSKSVFALLKLTILKQPTLAGRREECEGHVSKFYSPITLF